MVKALNKRISAFEEKVSSETPKPEEPAKKPEKKNYLQTKFDNTIITLSGQINRAQLHADNGNKSKWYNVDNSGSPSRLNVTADTKLNDDISAKAAIEIAPGNPFSNDGISFPTPPANTLYQAERYDDGTAINVRKAEGVLSSKTLGTIYLGKGDTASAYITEYDLSGTDAAAPGASVTNPFGGLALFSETPEHQYFMPLRNGADRTPIPVAFVWDNMNGLSRAARVRYDTPKVGIFTLGTSYTNIDSGDVALKWDTEVYKTKIVGGVAYSKRFNQWRQYSGSTSVLFPCGFNLGFAGGIRNPTTKKITTARFENGSFFFPRFKNATFLFGKVGYKFKIIEYGDTAVAVNVGTAKQMLVQYDFNVVAIPKSNRTKTYGFAVTQFIDIIHTELYLAGQLVKFTQDRGPLASTIVPQRAFRPFQVIFAGLRIKF